MSYNNLRDLTENEEQSVLLSTAAAYRRSTTTWPRRRPNTTIITLKWCKYKSTSRVSLSSDSHLICTASSLAVKLQPTTIKKYSNFKGIDDSSERIANRVIHVTHYALHFFLIALLRIKSNVCHIYVCTRHPSLVLFMYEYEFDEDSRMREIGRASCRERV